MQGKFVVGASVVACVLSAQRADAVVVWADDFTGEASPNAPASDFAGGAAGSDYGTVPAQYTISDAVGNAAPAVQLNDTGSAAPTFAVTYGHFGGGYAGLSASNNLLTTRFDFRVDDFNSGAAENANPRFIVRDQNLIGRQITVAFGRTNTDIDDGPSGGTSDLALTAHVATSNSSLVAPTAANAIGLEPGVGWTPGFDFGNYDPDTTLNDTHDQFYRIVVTYDFNTGGVTGSATNVATGESAPFAGTMLPSLTFTTTHATNGTSGLLMSSFGGNTALAYFDNIEVSVTPEPSTALTLVAGAGLLAARRRRSQT